MGLADFIEFDDEAYKMKVATLSTAELRQREVLKTRQQVSAAASVGIGAASAWAVGPIGLAVATCGWRRGHIADQKRDIIRDELKRRGVALHERTVADVAIPTLISLATATISAGADGVAGPMFNKAVPAATDQAITGCAAPVGGLITRELGAKLPAQGFNCLANNIADREVVRHHPTSETTTEKE